MTEGSTLSLKTQVEERPRIYGLYFSVSFLGYNVGDTEEGEERIYEDKESVVDNFREGWEDWKDWLDWQDQRDKKDRKDQKDKKDREDPEDEEEGSAFADEFPSGSFTQNSSVS